MADSITRETVLEVARLAKLQLPEDAIAGYQQHLDKILDYIGQISQHPCGDQIVPFFGACESVNAVREDLIVPSYPRERMLDNAPYTDQPFYLVPQVIE